MHQMKQRLIEKKRVRCAERSRDGITTLTLGHPEVLYFLVTSPYKASCLSKDGLRQMCAQYGPVIWHPFKIIFIKYCSAFT